jgi:serine/threonine protein kinase
MIRLPKIGQMLIDRYLILEKLGSGGFSEIYLARDKATAGYPCRVVKCLRPSLGNSLRVKITRRFFEREAKILKQLGCEYDQIPMLHDYCQEAGAEAGQVYLVQEYIEGDRLDHWMTTTSRISPKAVIEILLEVLNILDFVHSHAIIHCDIKPSNLIRRHSDGKLVLIDFGAACYEPQSNLCYDLKNEPVACVMGTEGYMPEEQDRGEFRVSSDLYALGILGIHLLTRVPVQELRRNKYSGELDWQHYLRNIRPSHRLVDILDRMARADYRDRYPTAQAVIDDLGTLTNWKKSFRKGIPQPFRNRLSHPNTINVLSSILAEEAQPKQPNPNIPMVAQHSIAQHSIAQHSISQHSISQHSSPTFQLSKNNELFIASTMQLSPMEMFPPE